VITVTGRRQYGDGFYMYLYFANVDILESLPSTPLNGSSRNFNTWRVSVGNRILRRDFFGYRPPKIWGPKNYRFSTTSQLSGIDGQYLQRGTWHTCRQSWNGVGNYEGCPISSKNFM